MSIKVMTQALEALESITDYDKLHAARVALRAALSQQPDNTACKSVQKRLEAQQPATAIACGIPGMVKTTCPYCEQGFAFEYEQADDKTEEPVAGPTTYQQRFTEVVSLLCRAAPPSDMVEGWLTPDADDHRLQEWAIAHAPNWSQGIGVLDAAHVMADQPAEGEGHETRNTHPAPGVPDDVQRDAERYRWLRENGTLGFSGAPSWRASVSFDAVDAYAQTLDSNIDATQAQKGQP